MAYFLTLPDGRQAKFADSTPKEEAEIFLREKFPDLYPKSGGITGAIGKGAESLVSGLRAGVAGLFDAEQAAKDAALRERSIASRYANEVGLDQLSKRYAEEGLFGGAKEVVRQAPSAIAEQVPQVGLSLGSAFTGARLGAMAGAPFGPVGVGVGATVGGALGQFAPSYLREFGSNLSRQAAEGKTINAADAAAAAAVQAGLETAAGAFVLGKQLVGKLIGIPEKALDTAAGKAVADASLKRTLTTGAAKAALVEIPTEVTQSMLERLQAGLSLTSDDALKEYGEAAYQTALAAPAFGAAARYQERGAEREKIQQEKVKQQQEAAEKEAALKKTPEYAQALNQERVTLRDEIIQIQQAISGKALTPEQEFDAKARIDEIKARMREIAADIKENVPQAQRTFADIMRERKEQEEAKGRPVVDEFGNIVPGLYQPRSEVDIAAQQAEAYDRMARMPQALLSRALQDWNDPVMGGKIKKKYPTFHAYTNALNDQRLEEEARQKAAQEAKDKETEELTAKLRADEIARRQAEFDKREKEQAKIEEERRREQLRLSLTDAEIKKAQNDFKKNPALKALYSSIEEYAIEQKQDTTLLGFPTIYVNELEEADAQYIKQLKEQGKDAGTQRQQQLELEGFEAGVDTVARRLENPRMVVKALGLPDAQQLDETDIEADLGYNLGLGRITKTIAKALGLPVTPFSRIVGGRNVNELAGNVSIRSIVQDRINNLEAQQKTLLTNDVDLLKPDGSSQLNEQGLLALRREAQLQTLRQYLEIPEVKPETEEGIAGALAASAIQKTEKPVIAPTKITAPRSDIEDRINALEKRKQYARETRDEEQLANINKQLEELREQRFAATNDPKFLKDQAFQDFVDYTLDAATRLKRPATALGVEKRINRLEKYKAAAKRKGRDDLVRQIDKELAKLQETESVLPLAKTREQKTEQITQRYVDALLQQIANARDAKGQRGLNQQEVDEITKQTRELLSEYSNRMQALSFAQIRDNLDQVTEKRVVADPKNLLQLTRLQNELKLIANAMTRPEADTDTLQQRFSQRVNFFLKQLAAPARTRVVDILTTPTFDTRKTEERPFADPRTATALIQDQLEEVADKFSKVEARPRTRKEEAFTLRAGSEELNRLRNQSAVASFEAKQQTIKNELETLRLRLNANNMGLNSQLEQALAQFESIDKPSEELVDVVLEQVNRIVSGLDTPFDTDNPDLKAEKPRFASLPIRSAKEQKQANRAWYDKNRQDLKDKQQEILEARAALDRDIADGIKALQKSITPEERAKLITPDQIKKREAAIEKLRTELKDLAAAKPPAGPTIRYNLGQAELLPKIKELLKRETEVTSLEQQLELFEEEPRVFIRSTPEILLASSRIINGIKNIFRGQQVEGLRSLINNATKAVQNQTTITLQTLAEVRRSITGLNGIVIKIEDFVKGVNELKNNVAPLEKQVQQLEKQIQNTKKQLEESQNKLSGTEGVVAEGYAESVVLLNTKLKKLEADHSDALSIMYQAQIAFNEFVKKGPVELTEQEISLRAALDERVVQERQKLDKLKERLAELKQNPKAERNIGEEKNQQSAQDKQRALVAQLEAARKELADAADRNKRIKETRLAAMDGIVSLNEAFYTINNRYKIIPASRRVTTPKLQATVLLPVTSTEAELNIRIKALKKARNIAEKNNTLVKIGTTKTDRLTIINQQIAAVEQQIQDIRNQDAFVKANEKAIIEYRKKIKELNKQLENTSNPKAIEKITAQISTLETRVNEAIEKKNINNMSNESLNEIRGGTIYQEDYTDKRTVLIKEEPLWLKEQRNIEKNYQAAVERLAKKYKVSDEGVEEKIQLFIDKRSEELRNAPSEDTKGRSKLEGEIKELRKDLATLQGDVVLLTDPEIYRVVNATQQTEITPAGKLKVVGEQLKTQRLKPLKGGGADQRLATEKTPDLDTLEREKRAKNGAKSAAARNAQAGITSTSQNVEEFENTAIFPTSLGPTSFRIEEVADSVVDLKEARQKIEQVKANLPKGVKLVYAETLFDAPKNFIRALMQQGMDEETAKVRGGVMPDGTVVIIGVNHGNMLDLETTIAHELIGHYGVDIILGERGLDDLVFRVDSQPGGVIGLAKEMGVHDEVYGTILNLQRVGTSIIGQQRAAIRELIAHVEEARATESTVAAVKRFVQEMIGALRQVLRDVLGLGRYSALKPADIYYLLSRSRRVIKSGTPGAYRDADGQVVFRRSKDAFPSNMPANYATVINQITGSPPSTFDKIFGGNTGMTFRTKYIDRFDPLERIAAQMKDSLAATQMMSYLRMHDQRNNFTAEVVNNGALILEKKKRADGREEFIVRSGGTVSLKDVAAALKEVPDMGVDSANKMFTSWMAAIRAERVGLDTLNFDPSVKLSDLVGLKRYVESQPEIKKAFDKARTLYNEYNRNLVKFAVQTGAISKIDEDRLLRTNDYIPFYRVQNGTVQLMLGGEISPIRIGNLKDQPYLDQLVGGNTKILDFFTSSVQNTNMFVDFAMRNLATKNVAYTLRSLGTSAMPVAKIGKGDGPAGANVIRFKERGEPMYAVIDTETLGVPADLLVKGLEGVSTTIPQVVKLFNIPSRVLRLFITRNPLYAFRQLFRDSMSAALTTGGNFTPVLSSLKELRKMRQGKSESEKELRERGVLGGQVFTGTSEDLSLILRDIASGKEGWATKLAKLDTLAIQGDASTRVVLYNSFIKQGMSEMEATLATLESMNFNRRGLSPSVMMLSMMVPFLNAQIQGLDVLYRSGFAGKMPFDQQLKVRKKFWTRGMMLAGMTVLYAAMMQDDEAYKNANPDEKYNNFFVYIPGFSEPFRIPIPFEVGVLFKALPEMIVHLADGKAEVGQVFPALKSILSNTMPGLIPQAIKPALEVATNYSFFSGRGIESEREEALIPSQRMRSNTSEVAKMLSSLTSFTVGGKEYGLSPIQLDYLVRGYFGPLGLAISSMGNTVLEKPGKADPEMRASDMPIVGGLFQPRDAQGLINYAYQVVSNIEQRQRTYKELARRGDASDVQEFVKENRQILGLASSAGSFRQQMGEYAQMERDVRERKDMSPQQKRETLDRIRQARIGYAQKFIAATAENRRQVSR